MAWTQELNVRREITLTKGGGASTDYTPVTGTTIGAGFAMDVNVANTVSVSVLNTVTVAFASNPTVNQGNQKSSGVGWRFTEYGVTGLANYYQTILAAVEVPASIIIDPVALTALSINAAGAALVTGDIPHDTVDSGNPVKMGGKASSSVPTAVASADRVNAYFDTTGYQHTKDEPQRPSTIDTTFSAVVFNATTTRTGTSIDTSRYRALLVYLNITKSGSPTSVTLQAQFSDDGGTTWFSYSYDAWNDLIFVAAQMPVTRCFPIEMAAGRLFRLRGVSSGTNDSRTITVTARVEGLS